MAYGDASGLHNRRIVVTGGCGFIGSAVVRYLVGVRRANVLNLDNLTYAGTKANVASVADRIEHRFERLDICDGRALAAVIGAFKPDAVLHLAAESHVDRSIDGPAEFIRSNVMGTYTLLEAVLAWYRSLSDAGKSQFRFVHISTDEVYGALLNGDTPFTEESPHRPNSPYSATKAASDHLVRAWGRTYGLPVIISNCSNNYGPYQSPEKMIPTMILSALQSQPLPVYGTGENIRDWLFVDDHVSALALLLQHGRPGETYLIGGGAEIRNLDLVYEICAILDELRGNCAEFPHKKLICFVPDRPGHDLRYAVDSSKIRSELGWHPTESFVSGLRKTVLWYLQNESWWRERIVAAEFGRRRGLQTSEMEAASAVQYGAQRA